MSAFRSLGLKIINDYKALLRRIFPSNVSSAKIKSLNIKRKQLKSLSDLEIHKICTIILVDLESNKTSNENKYPNYYSGIEEFIAYVKRFLSEYNLEGKRLVNSAQKASCALVSAIQLITLSKNEIDDINAKKLFEHSRLVAKHGNIEQISMLIAAIKKHSYKNTTFFVKLLDCFG